MHKISELKDKIKEKMGKGSDDSSFSSLLENFNEMAVFQDKFLDFLERTAATQQQNQKLSYQFSSFIDDKIAGPLKNNFEIQDATRKFHTLQNTVGSTYLHELVVSIKERVMKPLLIEKEESGKVVKSLLDERKKIRTRR